MMERRHNPHYLSSAGFDTSLLRLSTDINEVVKESDILVVAIPSAYLAGALKGLKPGALAGKKIISAIKGIIPGPNVLLNEYLETSFGTRREDYFAVLGPCHAEEVAAEKLSYLTISGDDMALAATIAGHFNTPFIRTVVNHDILGVQYAAVLKNIYALGAGIAHGLDYGDNFLSVYIANSADEMVGFLKKLIWEGHPTETEGAGRSINYAASVYLGDLLVTCYSLYSRNRSFGAMIGKGYSVKAAQLEMNMVAEGYNAAKCIHTINQTLRAEMPVAGSIYRILWEQLQPREGFRIIEERLI